MKISELKSGSILSETSFFKVSSVTSTGISATDDLGNKIDIGKEYVESILSSADIFKTEEKKTMTELAELFISSPRIAMTVAFYKKDQTKTKKVFEAEKEAKIKQIQNARVADVPALLNDLIEKPLSKVIPGELRIMKGRHYGHVDELGRVHLIDMEQAKDPLKPDYDSRKREVDPPVLSNILLLAGLSTL